MSRIPNKLGVYGDLELWVNGLNICSIDSQHQKLLWNCGLFAQIIASLTIIKYIRHKDWILVGAEIHSQLLEYQVDNQLQIHQLLAHDLLPCCHWEKSFVPYYLDIVTPTLQIQQLF